MPITAPRWSSGKTALPQPVSYSKLIKNIETILGRIKLTEVSTETLTPQEKYRHTSALIQEVINNITSIARSNESIESKLLHFIVNGTKLRQASEAVKNHCNNEKTTPEDEIIKENWLPFIAISAQKRMHDLVKKNLPDTIPPEIQKRVLDNFFTDNFPG